MALLFSPRISARVWFSRKVGQDHGGWFLRSIQGREATFDRDGRIVTLAGLLAAPLQGVIPEMGGTILAEAFVVTVVGGMGSIGGAVLAGLLVGVVVSMTSLFAPEMAKVSIFALMAVVLIVRPQGFFGRAGLMS